MHKRKSSLTPKQYRSRVLIEWNYMPCELLLMISDHLNLTYKLALARSCKLLHQLILPTIKRIGNYYMSNDVYYALVNIKPGIIITNNILLVMKYLYEGSQTLICRQPNWSSSHERDYTSCSKVIIPDGEELLLSKVPVDPYNNIVSQCPNTYILLQTDIYDKQIDCNVSYVHCKSYKPDVIIQTITSPRDLIFTHILPEEISITLTLMGSRKNPTPNEVILDTVSLRSNNKAFPNLSILGEYACKHPPNSFTIYKHITSLTELKRILAIRCQQLVFVVPGNTNYSQELPQLIYALTS